MKYNQLLSSCLLLNSVHLKGKIKCVDMQKEVIRLLAKWTWKDMRPIFIVCDDDLKELLSFLVPNYKPPSTTHTTSLIRKDY